VEHLGSATLLHVRCPGIEADVRIQLPGIVSWQAGQEIAIEVPATQCTVFDAAGLAIAHGIALPPSGGPVEPKVRTN
jgi:hypothetical protein